MSADEFKPASEHDFGPAKDMRRVKLRMDGTVRCACMAVYTSKFKRCPNCGMKNPFREM